MLDLTAWAVREALAYDGVPKNEIDLAIQLDEFPHDIRRALSDLAHDGEIRYCGEGRYVVIEA